jgi:hypothetical protein
MVGIKAIDPKLKSNKYLGNNLVSIVNKKKFLVLFHDK